ncbi:MAG: DNA-binding protein [Anaerolineae bacterium]
MASIRITLLGERLKELQELSERLGVPVEILARISVEDMLAGADDTVRALVDRILDKNRELYRRLAS